MRRALAAAAVIVAGALSGLACAGLLAVDDVGFEGADAAADGTNGAGDADGGPIGSEGGPGLPCGPGTKVCDNECVPVGPSYGCAVPGACASCPGPTNATAGCADGGGCTITCAPGFADCNGSPNDGCEAQPEAGDPANCGACGVTCKGDAGPLCAPTGCTTACTPPAIACGSSCANLDASTTNCGQCGKVCPGGQHSYVTCTSGKCGITCSPTDYLDCDDAAANGCEVNRLTDSKNCGSCGARCASVNGALSNTCVNGACHLVCEQGQADCNADPGDGCECTIGTGNSCLSGGRCGPCIANGTRTCLGDQDCCDFGSGAVCPSGMCCLPKGKRCSTAKDCCSGLCSGMSCE